MRLSDPPFGTVTPVTAFSLETGVKELMLSAPACDCLREDHRLLESLLDSLTAALEKSPLDHVILTEQFENIGCLCAVHFEREETLLYPSLPARYRTLLARMDDQHERIRECDRQVRSILAKPLAGGGSLGLKQLRQAIAELRSATNHHIADEEGLLFPVAAACLRHTEQARIATRMAALNLTGQAPATAAQTGMP